MLQKNNTLTPYFKKFSACGTGHCTTEQSTKSFALCRDVTCKLVKRAEQANFRALVLTVDAPMFGIRNADVRNKFTLPPHLR
jgi:isopentenyl diphosphate isomerase/L-lactate dehydrogenase-like FMN-dependent dehydrogenase